MKAFFPRWLPLFFHSFSRIWRSRFSTPVCSNSIHSYNATVCGTRDPVMTLYAIEVSHDFDLTPVWGLIGFKPLASPITAVQPEVKGFRIQLLTLTVSVNSQRCWIGRRKLSPLSLVSVSGFHCLMSSVRRLLTAWISSHRGFPMAALNPRTSLLTTHRWPLHRFASSSMATNAVGGWFPTRPASGEVGGAYMKGTNELMLWSLLFMTVEMR